MPIRRRRAPSDKRIRAALTAEVESLIALQFVHGETHGRLGPRRRNEIRQSLDSQYNLPPNARSGPLDKALPEDAIEKYDKAGTPKSRAKQPKRPVGER